MPASPSSAWTDAGFDARWTFTGVPGEPGSMALLAGVGLSFPDYEYATDWIFAQVLSVGLAAAYRENYIVVTGACIDPPGAHVPLRRMESKLDVEPSGEGRRGRGHLEMREDRDGLRYYLGGRRLERGDELELMLADGTWLRGAYEWRGVPVVWPALRVDLSGRVSKSSDRKLSTALPIPPGAIMRWPGYD